MYCWCFDDSSGNFTTGLIEEFIKVVASVSPEVVTPVTLKAPVIHEQPGKKEGYETPLNPPLQ